MPAIVVGAIVALLLGAGFVVLGSQLEREVIRPLADDLKPILNPGVLLLVFAGFALVMLRRGR